MSNKQPNIFDKIINASRIENVNSKKISAIDWFRSNVRSLARSAKALDVIANAEKGQRKAKPPRTGDMWLYVYDPKWKDILKYYDAIPLVIIIEMYDDGFLGMNLHYLPPKLRAVLFSKLWDLRTNTKLTDNAKFELSYKLLKAASKYKYFKPTIHRYLISQTRSWMLKIKPEDWMTALFLPVEDFRGASRQKVWTDSKLMVD